MKPATGATCCNETWESAYVRFETPEQEARKFAGRLGALGADAWPREAAILDLFCGRGGGLRALEALGFHHLEGVDLSPALIAQYSGRARCYVGDCRDLPFGDGSRDIVIVQGGLHHLSSLPGDLDRVIGEVHRVLSARGRFVVVEPWLTPFLRVVHGLCDVRLARHVWSRLDALAVMIDNERATYEQWLGQPTTILTCLDRWFTTERCTIAWGKISWVGVRRM